MDPQDRLFGEIAVRMRLLSREQVAACIHEQESELSPTRIGEVACRLGFLSSDDLKKVLAQQEAILERRRDGRTTQEVGPPPEAVATKEQPQLPRAQPNTRPASVPLQPAPAKVMADGDDYDFGATDSTAAARSPAVDAFGATRLQGPRSRDAEPAAAAPAVPAASAGTLVDAFGQAVQTSRARRRSFDDDWHNPAAPPAAAPAEPSAEPTTGSVRSTVVQQFRGTMVQHHGAAAAQQAEAAKQGAARALAPAPAERAPAPAEPPPAEPPRPPVEPVAIRVSVAPGAQHAAPKVQVVRPSQDAADAIADSYLGKALRMAVQQKASDLHAHSGAPLKLRIDGTLRPLSSGGPLTAEAAQKVIAAVMTDVQWATLSQRGEVDFALSIPGLARFRVNVYRQQRGLDVVFRVIPLRVPQFEELGLPARLGKLADFRTGMVLFTGPAGSGKSTSLAALINVLIGTRRDHLLTIENPVEFVFPPGPCLVNQRQVGDHTGSFARALRAALREDPDIIAITELRDRETMELAISAAETGHLVLGTLHTGSAGQTISRIVSSFPASEQEQVRVMLSESLRAVVSQRLVPQASGRGRVPAFELLMVNTAVMNVIRDDKTHQLPSVMQTGKAAGMVTLDDSLGELVRAGTITNEEARRHATKKERFGG